MNRGTVVNLSGVRVLEILKNNAYTLISFLFLILGVVCGLVMFNDFKWLTNFCEKFFADFLNDRQNAGYIKIVIISYFQHLLLFLAVFIFGTTLFGVVLVPVTLSFCGFFYGAAVAYLYSNFALKGVAFNAVIFLPAVLLLLLFLIFASKQAMTFSLNIARLTLPDTLGENLFIRFKTYSINFLVLTLGAVSSSLVDALTSISLLKFFEF
ncbi:MAG: hypothetical protein IKV81_06330 [Clostridia bacterium]|nr:hypothetical protein [Clostridia bacterium]